MIWQCWIAQVAAQIELAAAVKKGDARAVCFGGADIAEILGKAIGVGFFKDFFCVLCRCGIVYGEYMSGVCVDNFACFIYKYGKKSAFKRDFWRHIGREGIRSAFFEVWEYALIT